jgi:hypothetical protein
MAAGCVQVLEMVEFDRKQELTRLRKKADDFKRRAERGTRLIGDDEELRDLLIGAGDLEKKTAKVGGEGVIECDKIIIESHACTLSVSRCDIEKRSLR